MKVKKIISFIAIVVWLIVIFTMSAMPATVSNSQSRGIVNKVVSTKNNEDVETKTSDNLNKIVRKFAHNFEYLILAILILNYIRVTKGLTSRKDYLIAIIIAFLYACTDEYHQTFVDGRTGQFIDVLIDTLGASIGSLLVLLTSKLWHKKTTTSK